jgi:hypothetical protein
LKRSTILLFIFFSPVLFAQVNLVGESYTYKLTYLGIPAVNIVLSVPDTTQLNGRSAYRIVARARTNTFFSVFYTLDNRYETFVNVETGLPERFVKDIIQKTSKQKGSATYDQEKRTAYYEGGKFDSSFSVGVQERTHNFFSMIYALRTQPLHVGQTLNFNLDVETEPWRAEVQVAAKEKIEAAGKEREAFRVIFKFVPLKEEFPRRHTDIVTRRIATSRSRLTFWIGAETPHPFLKIEFILSPFNAYTILTGETKAP